MSGIRYQDHLGRWQECPMEEVRAGERIGVGVTHRDYGADECFWDGGARPWASLMEMAGLMRMRPGATPPASMPTRNDETKAHKSIKALGNIVMGRLHWNAHDMAEAACGSKSRGRYGTHRFHSMMDSKHACHECRKAFLKILGDEKASSIKNAKYWKWTPEQRKALAKWRREMGLSIDDGAYMARHRKPA